MSTQDELELIEERVCDGTTYISGSAIEHLDWAFRVHATCNSFGSCGWEVEWDDDPNWSITSDEFAVLHARHLLHAMGTKPRAGKAKP